MSHLHIRCPNCGTRPSSEFGYYGEVRPTPDPQAVDADEILRLWLRENVDGPQRERWFHSAGCRRFVTLTRDTRNNAILAQPGETPPAGATGDRSVGGNRAGGSDW